MMFDSRTIRGGFTHKSKRQAYTERKRSLMIYPYQESQGIQASVRITPQLRAWLGFLKFPIGLVTIELELKVPVEQSCSGQLQLSLVHENSAHLVCRRKGHATDIIGASGIFWRCDSHVMRLSMSHPLQAKSHPATTGSSTLRTDQMLQRSEL